MPREQQQGFDWGGARRRLDDWFVTQFACPVPLRTAHWPGGLGDAVHVLRLEHWCQHTIKQRAVPRGRVERGQISLADEALGIGLAALEIDAFERTCFEVREAGRLGAALELVTISAAARAELQALFERLDGPPLSRAFATNAIGRPAHSLASAVAQHLRVGGLSLGRIARFMNVSEGAVRWLCDAEDARTLWPLVSPEPAPAARKPGASYVEHRTDKDSS